MSDWTRVLREAAEDAPVSFDKQDRADGLHDANDPAAVQAALGLARVVCPTCGPQKTPVKHLISLRLSCEVIDFCRAQGEGWQAAIDEMLRLSVRR